MKKNIYLFIVFIVAAGCASTPKTAHSPYFEQINVQSKTIGISNTYGPGEIKAKEFIFPYLVHAISVDSTEMKALVRLRKPEETSSKISAILLYYDLNTENVIWTKRCNGLAPVFLKDKIIVRTYNKTLALNKNTGDLMWERNGGFGFINPEKGFALTGMVSSFDLNSGKDIWHRDIKTQFGSDEIILDGESLIASIDGLHSFNIQNGTGWDIDMSTGKRDEIATAAKNVGIVLLSAATLAMGGGPVTGHAKTNEFSGMTSNILISGKKLFFAAKDNLVCVEKDTGSEIWRTSLPQKKSAKSVLVENEGQILFVNKGHCYKNKEFFLYGEPYVAAFDKITGEQLFTDVLATKDYVKDVASVENGYLIATDNEVMFYGFDGKLNAKLDISKQNDQYGKLVSLLSNELLIDSYYIQEGEAFVPLWQHLSKTKHPMVGSENGFMIFGPGLDVKEWIPNDKLFYTTAKGDQNSCLRPSKYMVVNLKLAALNRRINSGTTKWVLIKGLKNEYAELETENHDVLNDIHLIDLDGNVKAKIGVRNPVKSTNKHIYFKTDNGLTLISKEAIDL